MKKSVGIIGSTGRMGKALSQLLSGDQVFSQGLGFNQGCAQGQLSLEGVFLANDYIIDFSNASLIEHILQVALSCPKPLILCSTGWEYEKVKTAIKSLSAKVPIVIAPNTSFGAYLQRYLAAQLAKFLGQEYEIDILDKHHKDKQDSPSGTAISLFNALSDAKQKHHNAEYVLAAKDTRGQNVIQIHSERKGDEIGFHEVSFKNNQEIITITHQALDRSLFSYGAMRILRWLETLKPSPGVYTMEDIVH